MPSLLLQKSSKDSRTRHHTKALERRLQLWTNGHLAELPIEGETIHSSLKQVKAPKIIGELSKKFCRTNAKFDVESVIKITANNMQNRILSLTDTTLKLLKQKHPKFASTTE